jgi:uncharacterized protein (DUF1499 family)
MSLNLPTARKNPIMTIASGLLLALILLVLGIWGAGQAGLYSGQAPVDLGVKDGRLKRPSMTPNSVSSQAALHVDHPMRAYAQVQPLPMRGDAAASIEAIRKVVEAMPGARVVKTEPGYLYATFTTRWMKYVDDVEFWVDSANGVVQVRSASRVGQKDFGVNRARLEAIRTALGATDQAKRP